MITKFLPEKILAFAKRFMYRKSRTVSQLGQDYWVYGEVFNEKKDGYFLDIGAHDGISINNTYLLESRYKWSGLCIEANPITFANLKKNRHATCLNICLDAEEGEVDFILRGTLGGIVGPGFDNQEITAKTNHIIELKTKPLMQVLKEQQAPDIIDYMSIDVEGAEERILGAFDFNTYLFRCITIERPTLSLKDILNRNSYILIKEIPDLDCFYVHESFIKDYYRNVHAFNEKKHLVIQWN